MAILRFPKGFLWGAATSSHQVEGHTRNNWSEWEKKNADRLAREADSKFGSIESWREKFGKAAADPNNYLSGAATNHWNRYEEDFDIAQSLRLNAYRFSIEWSRIEPEEGVFDEAAIDHYRQMLLSLKRRGIEPFVTLWHWTHPLWLEAQGGIEARAFPEYFARYAEKIVSSFPELVTFWITINEPTSVIGAAYVNGQWPPQKRSFFAADRVYRRLSSAHKRAYDTIKSIAPYAQVGFANILQSFDAYRRESVLDKIATRIARYFVNERFLRMTANHNDFLTAQFYFHSRLRLAEKIHIPGLPRTDLGWEIYPRGIYNVILPLKKYNLPIYITENGLADADDSQRERFIRDHLSCIHQAIEDGANVRGYFYWSLLDNFEWDKGFWPRFGLVGIDYTTQKRTIRESARTYATIAGTNTLEVMS